MNFGIISVGHFLTFFQKNIPGLIQISRTIDDDPISVFYWLDELHAVLGSKLALPDTRTIKNIQTWTSTQRRSDQTSWHHLKYKILHT